MTNQHNNGLLVSAGSRTLSRYHLSPGPDRVSLDAMRSSLLCPAAPLRTTTLYQVSDFRLGSSVERAPQERRALPHMRVGAAGLRDI